ncbi:MAG: hypothetical protein C0483_07600 [Pirellula sp.]|nr:hypothetical protein [Pirellula sp.]
MATETELQIEPSKVELSGWQRESWARRNRSSSEQIAYTAGRCLNAFRFHGKQFVMLAFRNKPASVRTQRNLAQPALTKLEFCVEQLLPDESRYWSLRRRLDGLVANWHLPHDSDPDFLYTLFSSPVDAEGDTDHEAYCDSLIREFSEVGTDELVDLIASNLDQRHLAVLRLGIEVDRLVRPASVHRRLFDDRKYARRCPPELAERFDGDAEIDAEAWYAGHVNRFANTFRCAGSLSPDEATYGRIQMGLQLTGLDSVVAWLESHASDDGMAGSACELTNEIDQQIWDCYVPRPQFLDVTGELFFRGKLAKRFRGQPAPNQSKILSAFERQSWAHCTLNPLADDRIAPHDWKSATSEALRQLNLNSGGIIFRHAGQIITWEAAAPPLVRS